MLEESKIEKKMARGRTKAELIVKDVLGLFFGNDIVKIMSTAVGQAVTCAPVTAVPGSIPGRDKFAG